MVVPRRRRDVGADFGRGTAKALFPGPLDADTPVWKKGFGETWRRLVDAVPADPDRLEPPVVDHGRWAGSFAKSEAHPRRPQWSWLGLLGPIAYFRLGMWRRALVLLGAANILTIPLAFADWERGSASHALPGLTVLGFCALSLKTDYYRFKVLGEPMWPRLRFMGNAWVCGGFASAAFAAVIALKIFNPADALMSDMSGVWQADGANVVIDVSGGTKSIAWSGLTQAVRVTSTNDDGEGLVFARVFGGKPITVRKRWSDDHSSYTLDLFEGDDLLANLSLLKPL